MFVSSSEPEEFFWLRQKKFLGAAEEEGCRPEGPQERRIPGGVLWEREPGTTKPPSLTGKLRPADP